MDGFSRPTADTLDALFRPDGIAFIGVGSEPTDESYRRLVNVARYGYRGAGHVIGTQERHVALSRTLGSVAELPSPVDLAVLHGPRGTIVGAVEDCAHAGVKAVVVHSEGFGDADDTGMELAERLENVATRMGIQLLGPGSLGFLMSDPEVQLNLTSVHDVGRTGTVSVITQAGPLAATVLRQARDLRVGLRIFVDVGLGLGITANDILEYLADDEGTDVIVAFVDSFGEAASFPSAARRVTARKPLVVVRESEAQAALDTSPTVAELLAQCGATYAHDLASAFGLAATFASQPLPEGRRVAVTATSLAAARLAADAVQRAGLELATPSRDGMEELRRALPAGARAGSPLVLNDGGDPDLLRIAADICAVDDDVDMQLMVLAPGSEDEDAARSEAIAEAAERRRARPLIVATGQSPTGTAHRKLADLGVPLFTYPHGGARALADLYRYQAWQRRTAGLIPELDVNREVALQAVRSRLAFGGGEMTETEVSSILEAYGIPVPNGRLCDGPEEAVEAAAELGYPVVLKLAQLDLVRKSEYGAVIIGPRNELEVRGAFGKLTDVARRRLSVEHPTVLVQEYIHAGVETVIRVQWDRVFGPLISFGLAGVYTEILKDRAFHVLPLSDVEARAVVRRVRSYPLLQGRDASVVVDEDVLVDALLKTSQILTDLPEIEELEIAPFSVLPGDGRSVAVDARVRLRTPDE